MFESRVQVGVFLSYLLLILSDQCAGFDEKVEISVKGPSSFVQSWSDFSTPTVTTTPQALQFDRISLLGLKCGPMAVHGFLRIHGVATTFDEVLALIPLGEHGASLSDLQTAATRFGIPASVRSISPEDLVRIPLPAIVHLEGPEPTGDKNAKLDHFALLTKRVEGTGDFMGIDTAGGGMAVWSARHLERSMTGYCLYSPAPARTSMVLIANAILSVAVLGLIEWKYRRGE